MGAALGVPSVLLIAYLGLRLSSVMHIPQPDTYPARELPTGLIAFWFAVVAVPTIVALLLLVARRFRTVIIGWLLTFLPICALLAINIASFDTHLMNH
ncbi:hypothetical protein AAFP30_10670 [Gordonia sp. CPCC 205515]|uniref:hypothetical protein n=1 Tax=Gordonia sp. CPCC 205515 TaxID=3140791 RepID=UPI003AF3C961